MFKIVIHTLESSSHIITYKYCQQDRNSGRGDTLDFFAYGCAAGILISLPYDRTGTAAFCDPILD